MIKLGKKKKLGKPVSKATPKKTLGLKKKPRIGKVINKMAKPSPTASPLANLGKSWLITNPKTMDKRIKEQQQQSARRSTPRFFLKSGDERLIRFRHTSALGCIAQYILKIGKNYENYTAPGINPITEQAEIDLFEQSGNSPVNRFLWEIIDRSGYYSTKKKEQITDVPRIWEAGTRLHQQIVAMLSEIDDPLETDFLVKRSGSGTSTSYTIIPKFRSTTPLNLAKIPSIAESVPEWYAPPSLEEQQKVLQRMGSFDRDTDVDDDDE